MIGLYPKKSKKNKTYYVRMLNYSFSMFKLDEKGNKIPLTNQVTGAPLTLPTGEPQFVTETVNFKPWKSKFSNEGYVCTYEVTPETPKLIADELEKDAKDRKSSVMDEETFIKTTNPDLYEQMKADAETQKVIDEKDAKINTQQAEIDRLKERLQKSGK
jgi:hypothetical protein